MATLDLQAVCVCANPQCRVLHFIPGTAGPRCPACYGEAGAATEVLGK